MMRRIVVGLLPATVAAGVSWAAAGPALAAPLSGASTTSCYGPSSCQHGVVSVTVTYGAHGVISIHVVATGYKPGERIDITITVPNKSLGAMQADANGSAGATMVLPAGVGAGTHTLLATGSQSGINASTAFYLSQSSGVNQPCTASVSGAHTSGVVLAAAYFTTSCASSVAPGASGSPGANGSLSGSGLGASGSSAANGAAALTPPASAHSGATLPFTGADDQMVASFGALAIGTGGLAVLWARRRRAWRS